MNLPSQKGEAVSEDPTWNVQGPVCLGDDTMTHQNFNSTVDCKEAEEHDTKIDDSMIQEYTSNETMLPGHRAQGELFSINKLC